MTKPEVAASWSEAAQRVLNERYLLRDAEGLIVESPDDMCWRVAKAIAEAERSWGGQAEVDIWTEKFADLMLTRHFLPNCVATDTLVAVDGGVRLLASIPSGVVDMRVPTDRGIHRAIRRFANGPRRVLTITTVLGYEVKATPEHLFRVIDEHGNYVWRRAGDMEAGDWMALQLDFLGDGVPASLEAVSSCAHRGRPRASVQQPSVMTPEIAELLGFYMGNGYLTKNGSLNLAVRGDDGDVVERLVSLIEAVFGCAARPTPVKGKNCVIVVTHSMAVRDFFIRNGLVKGGSYNAHVPTAVMSSGRPSVRAFLRGLFEADGCVTGRSIGLSSVSVALLKTCQVLLLGLGIMSRLSVKHGTSCLNVRHGSDGAAFSHEVGFLSCRKNDRCAAFGHVNGNAMVHGIPHQAQRLLSWYKSRPDYYLYKSIARFLISGPYAKNVSREAVEHYTMLQESPAAEHYVRNQIYDQVATVVPGEVEETGDLHVAEAHTFIANGFVSHNSPTLMNAGKNNGLQYSACYVLPVEDSIEGIFAAVRHAAVIFKSGGGVGYAFSRLRPRDSLVGTTSGVASGPVSFMRIFDTMTDVIKQGGKRRGANLGALHCTHPDLDEFITCKLDGSVTNFNISVTMTDAFMQAILDRTMTPIVDPRTGAQVGMRDAYATFRHLCEAAWRTGDPGLLFLDRANNSRANPVPSIETLETSNPCGETYLGPYDSCNLGSLNLAAFLYPDGNVDGLALHDAIRTAVRFLDDLIDVNPYPLPEVTAVTLANRRIGLGIMGWADYLVRRGVAYDSPAAVAEAESLMRFINTTGHIASQELAKERGPFPRWEQSIYRDGPPLRNSTVTVIAPTGSISIIADASSGIEPHFALAYQHIVDRGKPTERILSFVNEDFRAIAEREGFWSPAVEHYVLTHGRARGCPNIPESWQDVFVTAHDISPEWHVRMQAVFQEHTDNAVSKSVNMPHSATVDDIERTYLLAYELGCKGITVFRDGCKDQQVLNIGLNAIGKTLDKQVLPSYHGDMTNGHSHVKPRPEVLTGKTYRQSTPLGTAFVTVNRNGKGEPFEVFVSVGKGGSDTSAISEAFGRLLSLVFRMPSPLTQTDRAREVVSQLANIGGGRPLGYGSHRVLSLPDAVAQVLAEDIGLVSTLDLQEPTPEVLSGRRDLCPECGYATLAYQEGCKKCLSCGFSEC